MKFYPRTIILLILLLFLQTLISCKKDTNFNLEDIYLESKFFGKVNMGDPLVYKVADEIKRQNGINPNLIATIIKKNGFPIWEKARVVQNSAHQYKSASGEDTLIYIPLAIQGEEKVTAFFLATLNNYINLQLYNKFDYEQFGFDTTGTNSANKLAVQFMALDFLTFGHKRFKLLDDRLLKNFQTSIGHPIVNRILYMDFAPEQSRGSEIVYFQTCVTEYAKDCPADGECCNGAGWGICSSCVEHGCYYTYEKCKVHSFINYYDEYSGGNHGGGGGGDSGPISTPDGQMQLCNSTPLLQNGLPPCPKGYSLGWEPIISEPIFIDHATPPFTWSYNEEDTSTYIDPDPLLEPNFQFEPNDKYDSIYPKFSNMVKSLKTFVKDNPEVLNALQKWSGFSKQQILFHLTYGQGPFIKIEEMTGRYAYYTKQPGENILKVRASYVRGLEIAFLPKTIKGTAFLLAVSILHEYVHLGTYHNNISEGKYEFGSGFEIDAFNVIVEDTNANAVVIKFSEYF